MTFHHRANFLPNARQLESILLILVVGLAASGCGPSMGDVEGKVLFRGKPLAGAAVTFFPATGKGAVTGRVKRDGTYLVEAIPVGKARIAITPLAPGAKKLDPKMKMMRDAVKSGKNKVTPEELEKMPPAMREALEGGASAESSPIISKEYTDPEKTVLEYTVTSGSQTHNIELK